MIQTGLERICMPLGLDLVRSISNKALISGRRLNDHLRQKSYPVMCFLGLIAARGAFPGVGLARGERFLMIVALHGLRNFSSAVGGVLELLGKLT